MLNGFFTNAYGESHSVILILALKYLLNQLF